MEGPISFWGYKEQESNLILPEHDDDDDDNDIPHVYFYVEPNLFRLNNREETENFNVNTAMSRWRLSISATVLSLGQISTF
jgi:hypothetical protein